MDFLGGEQVSMLSAAGDALLIVADPTRLMFLAMGALFGLVLGIIPGIGGLAGTAMLLPFTFTMEPFTAFAFLLGLGATTATGDPIPAVLFGVPGGAGSAATVLDGHPMAKRGEAGRALSVSYMSSLMGGLIGAALLGCTIPLLRPMIIYIGSPELLGFTIFGISMVAALSGNAPLRGLTVACLGIMLAMIGSDPRTATLRWTMGSLYLWEGLPLVPFVLGLFALPELCDLAIGRTSIASGTKLSISSGMLQGVRDCFRHWFLILRCSALGSALGSIPGIGGSIIDWIAYGHALRTEKGASQSFGHGDVRGVIASESSNNAKEGGALVPTVAFGVPGSAGMAILLGAFVMHGLTPGPDMLTKHLDLTYSMVWSIAIANILGAGMCYLWSSQFAKLATLRYTLICPAVLSIIYIGAFEASRSWTDLYFLLFFGVLGWTMKQLKWPRPPLILGFVLGQLIERYMFISVERWGAEWLFRPVVMVMLALAFMGLLGPFRQDIRMSGGFAAVFSRISSRKFAVPRFTSRGLMNVFFIGLIGAMLVQTISWPALAKLTPTIVGVCALIFCGISLLNEMFRRGGSAADKSYETTDSSVTSLPQGVELQGRRHMDIDAGTSHVSPILRVQRAGVFFGWLLGFMASMAMIGLIPTVPLFVVAFMRLENREPWKLVVPQAVLLTLFIYIVFDRLMHTPWPQTLLATWFPSLKGLGIPSL
jgi:TctA family transporter